MGWITYRSRFARPAHRGRDARYGAPRRMLVVLAVGAGLVLGACSIPFGNGAASSGPSSPETARDRNRRYQQEQEHIERQYQFDRTGPSDR
jgi:hypothetical protein